MKFNKYRIAPQIKKRIEELGFKKPTDIQYKTIPSILKGEDVLAIAQTGTGKTAAYVIPILHMIDIQKHKSRVKGIKCLVMVPTRELAVQIADVFKDLGKYLKVNTLAVYGGVDQDPQIAGMKDTLDVLVATPGRMFDLIAQGHIRIDRLRYLVVDEADLMLNRGFYKDIKDVQRYIPKFRQTLFFSATIDQDIKKLAYSLVVNPIRIQLSPKDPVSKNVSHFYMNIEMDDKRYFLAEIIRSNPDKKVLVFVRTKVRAERVQKAMQRMELEALMLHGDVEQDNRLNILQQFKMSRVNMLISTDVSARGIDIPNVDLVVNYDVPDEPDTYVHRIGRTGRGRSLGLAYTFKAKEEQEKLDAIKEYTAESIQYLKISKRDYKDLTTINEIESFTMESLEDLVDKMESDKKKYKRKKRK